MKESKCETIAFSEDDKKAETKKLEINQFIDIDLEELTNEDDDFGTIIEEILEKHELEEGNEPPNIYKFANMSQQKNIQHVILENEKLWIEVFKMREYFKREKERRDALEQHLVNMK